MILSADSVPEPEDPNPIGWWPLNEGAGEIAVDVSGRGNDGTINNPNGGLGTDGSVWVDDPERGMVISFNGDNSSGAYIDAGPIIPSMTMENSFTWAFWAKQDESQGTEVPGQGNDLILGNRYAADGSDPLEFIKFTPGKFEYYNNDPDYTVTIDYDDIPGGVWIHHAGVKDGTTLTYYRNGVEAGTSTITYTIQANPFFMGGIPNGERWSGNLSDVRIYNRALTGLEVLAAVKGVEQIDMEVGYAIQPPVLDGEVDAIWAVASTQSFVPLEDPADGSGTWQVLYDAENLYVIVDVTDDSLQNDSASSWQDDSVEIYFDGGNTKLSTPLSGDDHQYTFGWTTDDIQGTNVAGYTEGIEHAQVTTDTGWRIEIKMPWLSIQGALPQAGDLIGIDCYYNDDDDGGDSREGKMLSLSAEEFWNNASGWGTAVLAMAPEPVDPGADGLVAYYALENNTDDSSGNDLHGTIVGAPTYVEGPAGYGTAMEFDGESYVDCGFDPRLDITGPISMGIWIQPGTDGSLETAPLCKADSLRGWSWQLRYGWNTDKPTIMGFQFNATDGRVWVYVNQDLAVGEWYHVAGAHDGETVRCYLDGLETDSAPMSSIIGGPSSLLIGSDGWRSDWIGAIDEVAIYDRGLSDSEVLYLAGIRVPDALSGLSDVTVVDGAIVSIRHEGTEYVVANGDLMLGTTTRGYIDAGVETLWAEGDPAPAATVSGTSNPKEGDVGSKADNFLFTLDGSTNISSIDGIDFQETIFPSLTDTFFLFERGGNDVGTWQAILADGSLGAPVEFDKASAGGPYANTGINVNGQDAYGVVFETGMVVQGVRITASGHDTLSISAVPAP